MTGDDEILRAVRGALGSEPRVGLVGHDIELFVQADALVMEGELDTVAAKKLALELAAAVPGVTGIVDRLRVAPAERMSDGQIADRLGDAFVQEGAFADYAIRGEEAGKPARLWRHPEPPRGSLDFVVENGVVTLNGSVSGLDHKRLAGVLAWWMPGSRDVVNGIAVDPPEEDDDGLLADAVRLALEKDPFVAASQIRVAAHGATVLLSGQVATTGERDMAENDAWYVFGVDRVVNTIGVSH